MGCGTFIAKIFLVIFNVVFWLCGGALLGLGIWIRVDPNALNYLHVATINGGDSMVNASAYVLIGVGAFIFLTGFCGCCGALKESTCMLNTYIAILVIIIILEVVAGILAIIFKGRIGNELQGSMRKTVEKDYNVTEGISKSWDYVQVFFECCGADNATDWDTSYYMGKYKHIPPTCCVLKEKNADTPVPVNEANCYKKMTGSYYKEGCYPKLLQWVNDKAVILIAVAIGVALVQVFGLLFACCLKSAIQKHKYHQV